MKKNIKNKLIVAKESLWDSDRELYYTHIGLNNSNMDLLITVWGKTPKQSKQRADNIATLPFIHNSLG